MTNLNNLTKLIHKAVPSILDLKFGCKVSKEWIKGQRSDYIVSWVIAENIYVLSFDGQPLSSVPSLKRDSFEILGRDITLEDVLVAMKKHYGSMWTHSGGVNIHILDIIKNKWKLNTPLHLQEQATIDFIYNLLKE